MVFIITVQLFKNFLNLGLSPFINESLKMHLTSRFLDFESNIKSILSCRGIVAKVPDEVEQLNIRLGDFST